jgi:hypothetical protein
VESACSKLPLFDQDHLSTKDYDIFSGMIIHYGSGHYWRGFRDTTISFFTSRSFSLISILVGLVQRRRSVPANFSLSS